MTNNREEQREERYRQFLTTSHSKDTIVRKQRPKKGFKMGKEIKALVIGGAVLVIGVVTVLGVLMAQPTAEERIARDTAWYHNCRTDVIDARIKSEHFIFDLIDKKFERDYKNYRFLEASEIFRYVYNELQNRAGYWCSDLRNNVSNMNEERWQEEMDKYYK